MQSFSALTLALSQKSCAPAQNGLSAAQFCAHFEILNPCRSTQRQRFFVSREVF